MVMGARVGAVGALRWVSGEGAYRALIEPSAGLDPRARRYATELVSGVTRWQRRLDFLIDHFFKGDPEKLEESIRQVLRIGLYELLILETPDRKSTRLNSSHVAISYADFCLKNKKNDIALSVSHSNARPV